MFTLPFYKFRQKQANSDNKGSTELYCLFIAADSTNDAIEFIWCIVVWFENQFSPNLALVPVRFQFLNPARSGSSWIWMSLTVNQQSLATDIEQILCSSMGL